MQNKTYAVVDSTNALEAALAEVRTAQGGETHTIPYFTCDGSGSIVVTGPTQQLAVGTLQTFLADYASAHPEVTVDYIHGEDSLRTRSRRRLL